MKKFILLTLIIICIMPTSMAYAYTASNVPSYLFDATYYSEMYDDLRAAFGTNKTKLYNHWCNYGKREGRSPSPVYNPSYYVNNNADLKKAFGNDYSALYNHFCTYGINEFRASSELYDGSYYKNTYGDLQDAFGNSSKKYLEHFMEYGMKEGRQANPKFNVLSYKSNYTDLRNAFGNNMKSYYYHYMKYGISEGRNAAGTTNPTSPTKKNTNITTNNATNNTSGLTNTTMSAIAKKIGTQNQYKYAKSSVMCTAFSMAYCRAYLFSDYREPTVYWKNGAGAIWSWGGGTKKTYRNNTQVLAAIKSQIDMGKPCIVRVNSSNGGHCIVVFKYSGNGRSTSDFTIIDPWSAKIKTLNHYTIHSTAKYIVTF